MSASASSPASQHVKVAHISSVDLSLRFLLLNQLEHIREAGYAVTGISSPGPHTTALTERNIRHIPVAITRSITPIRDLLALVRLYAILRREKFTIVHCHTPKAELIGQVAADIRKLRPPEPYQGKGIRYVGEVVRQKAGKAGKVGG